MVLRRYEMLEDGSGASQNRHEHDGPYGHGYVIGKCSVLVIFSQDLANAEAAKYKY